MKKKLIFGILFCVTICVLTSCSPKINGATPHRRDRNCGCENLSPTPYNEQCTVYNVPCTASDTNH